MKRSTLLVLIPAMALAGCELIVDFDRTKIPTDAADAAVPPPGIPDATIDPDASEPDGSDSDASTDDGGDGGDASDTDGGDEDGGDGGDAG